MNARAHVLLFRLAVQLAVAGAAVVAFPPTHVRVDALACSVAGGALVASMLAGRLPTPTDVRCLGAAHVVSGMYLVLGAFAEEALWRGLIFAGILSRLGFALSAAISVVGFMLAHVAKLRWRALSHVVTGSLFLTAYTFAGLWGAVAAHAAYNLTFLTLLTSERRALRAAA